MKNAISILILATLLVGCTKERPIKNCDTFAEMEDPNVDISADWSKIPNALNASFVSIDNKYPKSAIPKVELSRIQKVTGWKGEKLSAQILMWAPIDIAQVEYEVSDLKSKNSILPSNIVQTRFVRYVMTDEFADGCGHRKPEDYAQKLAPDMLDNLECFNMEAKTTRPVWVTVEIPRGAKEGIYEGEITLYAREQNSQKFTLEVEVLPQTLPLPAEWTFHLDLWQHPSAVARAHNLEVWSDAHFEKMKPIMKMLADAGQKVITANVNKDPWNNQCFDAYEDMIVWTKNADGTWVYDYTIFDRWVQYMMDLGVKKMLNCYSMVPWNNELHYIDGTTGETVNVKADPGTKEFEEMWASFLPDFTKHLKQKGWLEITNIAMDERNPEDMKKTLDMLQKHGPELGIALADNHKSYERYPFIKDMCVGLEAPVALKDILDRRERGLNTTYYVCCAHEFPNVFTFSDPAEATFMAWYTDAANYDGFLRWAYNSWVENPFTDSRFRTWPAGDTYSVYPDARSSIRFERMHEGIQDYEKIQIIRKQLTEKGDTTNLDKLNNVIAKLDIRERNKTWNIDLNNAKELLNKLSK